MNFTTVKRLVVADLTLHRKAITITGILFALLLFLFAGNQPWPSGLYGFLLFVGGCILSSRAFQELGDKTKAQFYLTLPCSPLEWVFSRWLLTAPLYVISTLLLYWVISLVKMLLAMALVHTPFIPVDMLNPWLWLMLAQYLVLQSLFFLGAATFKRFVLIKTLLSLLCFFIVLTVISWILLANLAHGYDYNSVMMTVPGNFFWIWVVLMPFCWYLTYLKLCNTEAR